MTAPFDLDLEPIGEELAGLELSVLNSDAYFNRVCKGKEALSAGEALAEKQESERLGAVRFFLKDGNRVIGILDYLLHNPGDGYPWLGLLLIRKEEQGKGYGKRALALFEAILKERGAAEYRIGVIVGNEPARRFWTKRGFTRVRTVPQDNRLVDVYEKRVG